MKTHLLGSKRPNNINYGKKFSKVCVVMIVLVYYKKAFKLSWDSIKI